MSAATVSARTRFGQLGYVLLECAILVLIAALTLVAVVTHSFLIVGDTLFASAVSALASLLMAMVFLRRQGVGKERVVMALTSSVSGIWLYELVYHYSYLDYKTNSLATNLSYFIADLKFLTINTDGREFPLIWAIIMISLPLVGYRYMRLNRIFVATLLASLSLFSVWIIVGYPQFTNPQEWPVMTPMWFLIPASYAYTNSPLVMFWAFVFNSATKLLAVVPSVLFYDPKRGIGFSWPRKHSGPGPDAAEGAKRSPPV